MAVSSKKPKRAWGKITVICPVCSLVREVSRNSLYVTRLPRDTADRAIRKCRSCSKREHYAAWFTEAYTGDPSKTRRQEQRIWAIQYLGGKCLGCSYVYDGTNAAVFDLHHRDPAQKDFNVSQRRYARERVRSECDKCDLLCANCHRLRHSGRY